MRTQRAAKRSAAKLAADVDPSGVSEKVSISALLSENERLRKEICQERQERRNAEGERNAASDAIKRIHDRGRDWLLSLTDRHARSYTGVPLVYLSILFKLFEALGVPDALHKLGYVSGIAKSNREPESHNS